MRACMRTIVPVTFGASKREVRYLTAYGPIPTGPKRLVIVRLAADAPVGRDEEQRPEEREDEDRAPHLSQRLTLEGVKPTTSRSHGR